VKNIKKHQLWGKNTDLLLCFYDYCKS